MYWFEDILPTINLTKFCDFEIFHFVFNNVFLASSGFFEDLIILITLSKFSTDAERPIKIWALSSAFFKSNLVFLTTTSSIKVKNCSKNSLRLQV